MVERVRMVDMDIAIEISFELPQLALLSPDDQIFIIAFLLSHGAIKKMERIFGVNYPTIKSRPTRIANALEFVETNPLLRSPRSSSDYREDITAEDAIREMEALQ